MDSLEIRLKRKIVFEGNSEELYGTYQWLQFLSDEEIERDHQYCDVDVYTTSSTDSDAKDISIKDMKTLIQKAEDAGANYIQIDWHCDHEEYNIYGSRISRMTEDETAELEVEATERAEQLKKSKIKDLEEELERLKNE